MYALSPGSKNKREIQLKWFALPYDYACFVYGYKKFQNRLLYIRLLYIRQIFLIQMEYPSAKHVKSYGRANRVSCISLLFLRNVKKNTKSLTESQTLIIYAKIFRS